jgi:hypothetical protein
VPETTCVASFLYRAQRHTVKLMTAPQTLSRKAIDEFKTIYQKEFGEEISDDEAQKMGLGLLRLLKLLLSSD